MLCCVFIANLFISMTAHLSSFTASVIGLHLTHAAMILTASFPCLTMNALSTQLISPFFHSHSDCNTGPDNSWKLLDNSHKI